MSLFESADEFVGQLEEFLSRGQLDPFNVLWNPYYWAGNEPDILSPWLFAWANRSDLSIRHTRWLIDHRYTAAADGIPGNDDYGAISGWLVWAYLGLYPLYSGNSALSVAAPVFSSVMMTRDGGATVRMERSGEGTRIRSLLLNGRPVTSAILSLDDLLASRNATLSWTMGN